MIINSPFKRFDIERLQYKIICLVLELFFEKKLCVLYDYAFYEACKNFVGIHDEFDHSNQELKYQVLSSLIKNNYLKTWIINDRVHIILTGKAIDEFLNKPKEGGRENFHKRTSDLQLLKSLPNIERL